MAIFANMPNYVDLNQADGYKSMTRMRKMRPTPPDAWYMCPPKLLRFVLIICGFFTVLALAWLAGIGRLGEFFAVLFG